MTELNQFTGSVIQKIESKIKYTFANKSLLIQAFMRDSFLNEHANEPMCKGRQSYQVLELYGDAILGATVVNHLCGKYGKITEKTGFVSTLMEGDLTTLKSHLSDKTMLSERITELGLAAYLLCSNGDEMHGVCNEASPKEDLFESIVGAVYLDAGKDADTVARVLLGMLDPERYLTERSAAVKHPKMRLQELLAKKHMRATYEFVGKEGPDNDPCFTVSCAVGDYGAFVGKGRSKKAAETAAADNALQYFASQVPADAKTESAQKPEESQKKNPKTVIKEWGDKTGIIPRFETISGEGMPPVYISNCAIDGKIFGMGRGDTKKDAERMAAECALEKLKEDDRYRKYFE